MCKDWILNSVRTMLRTKLGQRNCSTLTIYNEVNTALSTAQNTYAFLVGLVEGLPCADTMFAGSCV